MTFPSALMNHPFHRPVVVYPCHANVVAHRGTDSGGWYTKEFTKTSGCLRVKPHEHGDPVGGLPTKCGMDSLLRSHGPFLWSTRVACPGQETIFRVLITGFVPCARSRQSLNEGRITYQHLSCELSATHAAGPRSRKSSWRCLLCFWFSAIKYFVRIISRALPSDQTIAAGEHVQVGKDEAPRWSLHGDFVPAHLGTARACYHLVA